MPDVTARYFAAFRERDGRETEELSTRAATAGELFEELRRRHGFADTAAHCKVAVNGEIASWDTRLADRDTVLFFPPVAGG